MPSPQFADVTDAVEDVLGLSFPRCCVCDTGWYDAIEGEDDDDLAQSRKRKRNQCRPSHDMLLPMPACQCTTKLVLPSSVPRSIYSEKECSDPTATLSQIKTVSLPNLAICKTCLEHRIKASSEVTVHDYRQEHIPNGQQNVKFTVEPDCVQCKRKFMLRVLERLLASNGESYQPRAAGKGKTNVKWSDAIKSTIDVVGWVKRETRRDRRNRRRKERMENTTTLENNEQWKTLWEIHNCDGNGSSDDCYSCSSDESCDDDMDNRRKEPHRVESAQGELAQYLAEKDPKFKQALEDEQFVKKLAEEEEKERQRALEARAKEDHEMAMKLQAEYEKNSKKVVSKIEPRKTRRSPIVEAMKKASTLNERSPTPTTGREVDQQTSSASKTPKFKRNGVSGEKKIDAASAKKSQDAAKKPGNTQETDDDDDETSVKVREIINMGFSEGSARRCLKDSDGDVEVAVSMLLSEASVGASGSPVRKVVERSETIRIMFTGFVATRQHMQMIETIGATIVESIEEAHTATHIIVTDGTTKFRRTPKLMVCICKSPNIVKLEWLEQSAKEQRVLDTTLYLLIGDKEAEKRYSFSMKETIQNGIEVREKGGVLGGFYVYICSGVAGNQAPSTKELNLIIEVAGGKVLSSLSTCKVLDPAKTIVLTSDPSTPSQLREPGVKSIPKLGGKIVSTSWLFHVIITQCINPVIEVD